MYQQIVIIGSGRVASRTLEAVLRLPERPHVVAVEAESPLTTALGATCRRQGVPYSQIIPRDALVQFFSERPARTLVLSAHNVFIFPPALVDDARLTIVNFHNSLLPRHRGRNAPSWALFERDLWAGISWHRVTAAIDEGHFLCQRRIQPAWNTTAFALTQSLADLGMQALVDLLPDLVAGVAHAIPQDPNIAPSLHRSSEVPNEGFLDPNWSLAQASAFLRALDFGKLPLFPRPRVRLDGAEHTIADYRLTEATGSSEQRSSGRSSAHELRFAEAGLHLTVSLESGAAVSDRQEPILSQG
jgi:methionyl-tRNA formyltransferase